MAETKTIALAAGMLILLALVGTTYYLTNVDTTYYCEKANTVSMCFKLSNPTNNLSSRCYYNETTPTRYFTCTSGWKPIKNFPNIMNNLTITGNEIIEKTYDASLKEVTFVSNLEGEVASVKLNTPQVFNVIRGKDRKVAEMNFDVNKDYTNAIGSMKFTDLNTGKSVQREITYKYKTIENYEIAVNDYKDECTLNPKNNTQECTPKIIGNHNETREREVWIPLENLDLKKGIITIGIFADVYTNEKIEWVPTFFKTEVPEFATWQESYNVGLVAYYPLSNNIDVVTGKYNLSEAAAGSAIIYEAGLINNALNTSGTSWIWGAFNMTELNTSSDKSFSICLWERNADIGTHCLGGLDDTFNTNYGSSGQWGAGTFGPAHYWQSMIDDSAISVPTAGIESVLDSWLYICNVKNETDLMLYFNATLIEKKSLGANTWNAGPIQEVLLGTLMSSGAYPSYSWVGQIDEMAIYNRSLGETEIIGEYNGGAGMTYKNFNEIIILNSIPENNSNVSGEVTFGCNATGSGTEQITSVILNASSWTQTITGLSTYSYNATFVNSTLKPGVFNWNCIAVGTSINASSTNWILNHQVPLIGKVLTSKGLDIINAIVQIFYSNGTLFGNTTSNSTGDWTYLMYSYAPNLTVIGYNPTNTSQGGNAYPFINQ